ncbi:MAG: beta strand repeat-containing protein, partial [Sphingobacteriales bacterium]
LKANVGGGIQSETVGATTFAVGGRVTVDLNGGTDQTTLAMGTVTRSAGAAIDFVGVGGTLGAGANSPNVTSSSLPANTNGILDWATVGGTQWAENNSNSIRAYSGSFSAINSSTNLQNAQVSGSETLSGARVGNSLNLIATASGQSLTLGANNLTLGSAVGSAAAILKSGTDAYTISGTGQVRAGSGGAGTELIAHVDGGALTISAPLSTAIVGIAKGGTGDLILSGTRAGTMTGAIGIAGGQLEFQGASTTISGSVSGPGGITVNLNAGQTLLYNTTNMRYSGPTIVKGGILRIGGSYSDMSKFPGVPGASLAGAGQGILSNLELNGGSVAVWYYMSEFLGSGPGQIQLTGGTSGFSMNQADAAAVSWSVNADPSYEVVWGSPFFKPDVLLLGAAGSGHAVNWRMNNRFDLNGATRTIATDVAAFGGWLEGVIRNSSGTAGITKTGVGPLTLSGLNTFNGPVTINGGTLIANTLANGGSASSLGASTSDASNLVISGGTLRYTGGAVSTNRQFTISSSGTLDASGSGAINFTNTASPAYGTVDQTRTLTLTGTYAAGNNTLAANIADNGTGAVSVSKTGAGLWVLSGASSYTGATTLNAGTLSVSAVSNLGNAASNLVFNGGTLQISNTTNLPNFSTLGRTVLFTSGQTVGLDVTSGTFTVDQVLNQGTGGLSKAGAGTLVINSAHSYTGQTTINAGILQLNDGGAISPAPLFLNGGTFAVNRSTTATLGSTLPAIVGGTGSLDNISANSLVLNAPTFHTGNTTATTGNITLSHASAIQNSALNTTGAGTVTLSGVTTPTFGGLANSGTTRNLADVIDSSYASVTGLTLKPESAMTYTYGGVVADGATGMSLTKLGAGTQVLQGTNTYTGATTIKNGTLTLSGAAGRLTGTSGLNFNGGTLTLINTSATEAALDRVVANAIISNGGGNITVTNTASSTTVYSETLGALDLRSGQLNVTSTNANTTPAQTLTFGSGSLTTINGVARAVTDTSAITFSGASLGLNARNAIIISGQTDSAVGEIIGPWATWGTTAAAQTDYATYNRTAGGAVNAFGIQNANIPGTAETAWTTSTAAYTMTANQTLTGTRTITALRNATGSASVLTLATAANLETYGLLTGAQTLTVNPGTGGVLTTPTGGGSLYITSGGNAITVTSSINDNGGAVALVKSGASGLTLSGTNNYSGGTVLNAGTLTTTTPNTNLGTGPVTVTGPVTWNFGTTGSSRNLTINDGAALSITGTSNQNFSGVLAGNGSISQTGSIGINFTNTGNTFTGPINIGYGLTFASLGDSTNPINIPGVSWTWTGGAKTFALRPFTLSSAGTGTIGNSGTGGLVIQQPLAFSGAAGARTLSLAGNYTASANTFAGNITDGPGSVVSLTKAAGPIWALSGTNTYSGATTALEAVGGGGAFVFQGIQSLSPYTSLRGGSTPSDGGRRPAPFKILDDSANPASRSGVNLFLTTGNGQDPLTIFVGNNNTSNGGNSSGTTTGSTIQLGNMNFSQVTTSTAGGAL